MDNLQQKKLSFQDKDCIQVKEDENISNDLSCLAISNDKTGKIPNIDNFLNSDNVVIYKNLFSNFEENKVYKQYVEDIVNTGFCGEKIDKETIQQQLLAEMDFVVETQFEYFDDDFFQVIKNGDYALLEANQADTYYIVPLISEENTQKIISDEEKQQLMGKLQDLQDNVVKNAIENIEDGLDAVIDNPQFNEIVNNIIEQIKINQNYDSQEILEKLEIPEYDLNEEQLSRINCLVDVAKVLNPQQTTSMHP